MVNHGQPASHFPISRWWTHTSSDQSQCGMLKLCCFHDILAFKGELWCKNKNFSKERLNIIATNFRILIVLSYKLASNSVIEVDLKHD